MAHSIHPLDKHKNPLKNFIHSLVQDVVVDSIKEFFHHICHSSSAGFIKLILQITPNESMRVKSLDLTGSGIGQQFRPDVLRHFPGKKTVPES